MPSYPPTIETAISCTTLVRIAQSAAGMSMGKQVVMDRTNVGANAVFALGRRARPRAGPPDAEATASCDTHRTCRECSARGTIARGYSTRSPSGISFRSHLTQA